MADTPPCPTAAELQQFARGELPAARARLIEEHLKGCRRCVESLQSPASAGAGRPRESTVREDATGRFTGTAPLQDPGADGATLPHDPGPKPNGPDTVADLASGNQSAMTEDLTGRQGGSEEPPTVTQAPPAGVEGLDILAPPQEPGELGRLGPYRVLKVIGQGGMGIVFEAEDLQLGRPVALKVMKAAVAAGPAARQRFQREARSMAAVKSDHVVTIYQVGEDRGAPYLAMELLQGQSLDRWRARGRRPGPAEILRLGREVALGLAAAHERGVIHRDVKPGNIWLEEPGSRVKLLDFGLARAAAEDVQLTTSGAVVGTPAYMAPEQARGDPFDHRADLFSLGVVLYQLGTGALPFRGGTTMAVLSALANEDPRPVRQLAPEVPPALADLIMKLLAKDPAGRPAAAKDVVAAIQAIEREAALPPPGQRLPGGAAGGRRRLRPYLAAGVLFALLGGLAWLFGPAILRVVTGKEELVVDDSHVTQQALAGAAPGKDRPFVVVRGGERFGFQTFAEALGQRQGGEAIEVHGNGPFAVPAAEVRGTGLILRAAPGYRPVFVAQVEDGARSPWLAVLGGAVLVEGCDFHGDAIFPGWFFDSGPEPAPAAPWTFRNCRFWGNGARGLIAYAGPRLRVENSLVLTGFGEALLSLGLRADLEMTNNLVHVGGPQVILASGNQTVRLTNNYIEGGATPLLRPPTDEAPARPVTVLADGNTLAHLLLVGDAGAGMPSERVTRAQVIWEGSNNLHVRSERPFVSFSQDRRELKSLNDWNQFWGRVEPGSVELPAVTLRYNAFGWAAPEDSLRFVRSEVEALSRRLGDAARPVGPEWDLVGPGAAYIKATERAAGVPLPAAKLRPAFPAGGPFVRLRNGEEPQGHATLTSALDAVQDGDTVEVRGDGPFTGVVLQDPRRGGRLTLRAAPGYRPVVQTNVHLHLPKAEVRIDGLTFAEAHLSGEFARLTLGNCALHATKELWTLGCVLHGAGQAGRFVGCTFNCGPACRVGRGQSVLFENCVVSRTNVNARPGETDFEVILRRSLCWAGGLRNGSLACDLSSQSRPRIHAEDSLFVGGGVLTGSAGQAHWTGKHNVYALTSGFAVYQKFFTLKAWQERWDSDRDSVVTGSPFLEPRMWRLMPGHPRRPDGKDYGPDVDQVAGTTVP
jgi:hypothetical protein